MFDSTAIPDALAAVKSELRNFGWSGMAWACLRRNPRYRNRYEEFRAGDISEKALCAEFGLRCAKSPAEKFDDGTPPEFVVVRVVAPNNGSVAKARAYPGQLAVVMPLALRVDAQITLLKKALKELGASGLKLRSADEMVRLLAPRLLAYSLANEEGWGPSKIGRALFPKGPVATAKTAARDLTKRGAVFVESGYMALASQAQLTDRRRREMPVKAKPKALVTEKVLTFTVMPLRKT